MDDAAQQIEFFGAQGMEPSPAGHGVRLCRLPRAVREQLNERARFVTADSSGVELRFVTDAPCFDLYLSAVRPEFAPRPTAVVFLGGFRVCTLEIEPGKVNAFRINRPPAFDSAAPGAESAFGYAACVWRVQFQLAPFVFHGIDVLGHSLRRPLPHELPQYTWLAYGSSITHSHAAGYPYLAAARLGVQLRNLGMNGACKLDRALANHLADSCTFDFISCEVGINMCETVSPADFERRAAYLIERLVGTGKPVFLISPFANGKMLPFCSARCAAADNQSAYLKSLRRLVRDFGGPCLRLIEGTALLPTLAGLGADLLHPTEYGHMQIASAMVPILAQSLAKCGIILQDPV